MASDPSAPTREELIEAYTDLGDAELLEHAHAVNEAMARRRTRQALVPYPPRYAMPANPGAGIDPVDLVITEGPVSALKACTCGIQAVGGKCDDWCDLVRP